MLDVHLPEKMKRPLLIGLTVVLAIVGILVGGLLFSNSAEDAELRRERNKVYALIEVGQNLSEAEGILRRSGFELYHDGPIQPTIDKDYLQQLVIIGDATPSGTDTFFYSLTGGANPLRDESPYVIIGATNDGAITRIE